MPKSNLFYGLPFAKPKGKKQASEKEAIDHYPYSIKFFGLHAITPEHYKLLLDTYEANKAQKESVKEKDKRRKNLLLEIAGLKGEKKFKKDSLEYRYNKDLTPAEVKKIKEEINVIDETIKKLQDELKDS
jgi:hypothetical protein